ncbi:MAG: ABC transporter ATP-binding protein [Campylobacteraceae bacterium]
MSSLVTCKDLRFSYGEKEILHGLNFEVSEGGIVGLLGKNGAGKSTTINILMGFLQQTSGECSVLGYPSYSIPPFARDDIGLLHEGFIQYDFMTIEQIEKFYSSFYKKWNKDLYYDLVSRIKVPYNRRITKLSCGQRSQITLGLILAQSPKLMILDDFSMGLDVGYRRLFLEFLKDFVDTYKTTVLLTSHIIQELDLFLDKLIIIKDGNIINNSSRDEFLNSTFGYELPIKFAKEISLNEKILNIEYGKKHLTFFGFLNPYETKEYLKSKNIDTALLKELPLGLEDTFIGLTGRY